MRKPRSAPSPAAWSGRIALAAVFALAGTASGAGCRRGPDATRETPAADSNAARNPHADDGRGEPRAATAPLDVVGSEAPVAPADAPPAETTPEDTADQASPEAAPPTVGRPDAEPILTDGDVSLALEHLGRGPATRTFEVSESCALGRVELDVGVDSMPDGFVTLTAPSGRAARLRLRVLQIEFIKTWRWEDLEGLHAERGTSVAGTWTFQSRLAGADYAQPSSGETAPMPVPDVTLARLRLFCEPAHDGGDTEAVADGGTALGEWTTSWEPHARAVRPGAHPRTLVAVHRDCRLGGIVARLELGFDGGIYGRARLVAPDGTVHPLGRVEASAAGGGAGRHPISRTVLLEDGPRAAGLWELAFAADGAGGTLETAGLTFLCSGP